MTILPPEDDQKLLDFLRQYRPTPPSPPQSLENSLLAQISKLPPSSSRPAYFFWFIPVMIAFVGIGVWGLYRSLNPNSQMAVINSAPLTEKIPQQDLESFSSSERVSSSDLETFFIESWTSTIEGTSNESENLEVSWYALIDSN